MKNIATCLVLIVICLAPGLGRAEEHIRLCFEEWAPFAETREGVARGIQVDIMQQAFDRAGLPVSFEEMPYVRCRQDVKQGRYDGILASSYEYDLFPVGLSVLRWEMAVFVHEDYPASIFASLDDFLGLQVGIVDGYDYGDDIMGRRNEWDAQDAPDALFNLRKLAKKRIDFTFADILWGNSVKRRENLPVKALFPTISSVPQYTYFNDDHAVLIPRIEAAMQEMKEDGTIETIYLRETGLGIPSRWLAQ
ncbi:substrate-binding periplasmic protein [Thalassospira aquimaris]|uniref:Transporter substrate-binding domain-containing protein n=1 Tax=Thalassospira aquimaris TaxID=3037796 RepID=A0ABT6GED0_9PROT|nr:transporter substrate-binding domain-containing protein [Thalassospira sp. FZY0004]MDG4720349.1 transporter substrate-binding domain-containing protein [Thalassospira sp. FZY0004]